MSSGSGEGVRGCVGMSERRGEERGEVTAYAGGCGKFGLMGDRGEVTEVLRDDGDGDAVEGGWGDVEDKTQEAGGMIVKEERERGGGNGDAGEDNAPGRGKGRLYKRY